MKRSRSFFGHAAFWGGSAYATGLVAIHYGVPFPLAVVAGALFVVTFLRRY